MNQKAYRFTIKKQLLVLTILPIICLGIITSAFGFSSFRNALIGETEAQLKSIGDSMLIYFDLTYPGDYSLSQATTSDGATSYDLLKGDTVITKEYEYIDTVKETTGIDITLFYQDTRILTTIRDSYGSRYIGTTTHPVILQDVLYSDEAHFYHSAVINTESYFAYYSPIHNSDGTVIGMLFVGKPSSEVQSALRHALIPIFFIVLLTCVGAGLISLLQSKVFVFSIQRINQFLTRIAQGSLNAEMDVRVLARRDELGDMGRSVVSMQNSLRALVEQDALTGLNNRRYGDKRLHQLVSDFETKGVHFSIAIGDIDFFKKINDTYGHEAGDVVLKGVADIMREHMRGKGFVARWGGEEFLLAFENITYEEAASSMKDLLNSIRAAVFTYEDTDIRVTMSFGMAEFQEGDTINNLLKCADDKLYKGKTEGRNQIVS